MSAAISPATGRSYGVQRVCRLWALPRSSFYHAVNRNPAPLPPARDALVRARCHAAMTSPTPRGRWTGPGRLIDVGLAAGVALYAVSTVLEALRLFSFSLE